MQSAELTKNRWLGMKIMSTGFVIVALAALLAWVGFESGFLFLIGWLLGVVGMAVHSRQFYREMKAGRPAKQRQR